MKQVIISLLTFGLVISLFGDDIPLEYRMQEGVTLCLDFDKSSVTASRATGDNQSLKTPNGILYEAGIKGKALKTEETGIYLSFKLKDNLSFEKPGSVSIWIKPLKWKYPQDMPILKDEHRERIYYLFFATDYQKKGYLGFQRVTSWRVGGNDSLRSWFSGFEGISANGSKEIIWADGQWHNAVMTWDPLEFKIYIDGELQITTIVQRKIKDDEIAKSFCVACPPNTMIDEFVIYNRLLTAEEIKKYYEYLNPKPSDIK